MSALLKKIQIIDGSAAHKLINAKFCSDVDLQSLTRQDLNELFPGDYNLRRRKLIFDTIHKQTPVHLLLKDLKDFIPEESFRAALGNNGVLLDYLHMLKDLKEQMNNVQMFLDAHISLLEDMKKPKPEQPRETVLIKGQSELVRGYYPLKTDSHPSTSAASVQTKAEKPLTEDPPPIGQLFGPASNRHQNMFSSGTPKAVRMMSPPQKIRTVRYKAVVSGKTLGADKQILDRVQAAISETMSLKLEDTSTVGQNDITFVFCPIVSRSGTDINEALKEIKGDEPVILVVMHHSFEPKILARSRNWTSSACVVLDVHVFYHDTNNGLLSCLENDSAISQIRGKLQNYGDEITEDSVIENPQPCHGYNSDNSRGRNQMNPESETKSSAFSIFSNFISRKV